MRIAHIINPVKIEDESRDLHWQQPITFESMKTASDFAHKPIIPKGEYSVEIEGVESKISQTGNNYLAKN